MEIMQEGGLQGLVELVSWIMGRGTSRERKRKKSHEIM
jgi:hypothetical protein